MDYQMFVDTFTIPCCVMEVEKKDDGSCGLIRIHRANDSYKTTMGPAYYDDMPYYELVPKEPQFERCCFQAAHFNQRIRAYVETRALNSWTDQQLLPLKKQNETTGYCLFLFEFTAEAEPSRMAEVSRTTAEKVIQCCVSLTREADLNRSLDLVTKDICEIAEADSCRIFLLDHINQKTVTLSRYTKPGVQGLPAAIDGALEYEAAASWKSVLGLSNDIIIKDSHDMAELKKRAPDWYENIHRFRIRSVVLIPLRRGDQIIGYLSVLNYNTEKTAEVTELIELLSFFLGTEISNHQMRSELEYSSTHDAMTGILGRAAWMKQMELLEHSNPKLPFGIISMDLNGLKETNDRYGHEQGDRQITESVRVMSEFFRKDQLYRISGDEFAALVIGGTEEEFRTQASRLQNRKLDGPNVSISAGICWAGTSIGPKEAIRIADKNMYSDKAQYYKNHPDRKMR
ncbi:MAG: sensor domain-containing diguanylate cyclase [Solobacterium sp.]|nr:sensor domain-containing diguanylate cyclase [Solobacterium sp.]